MKQKDQQEEAKMKERLLNAALRFVPKYGWSKKAIIEGDYIYIYTCEKVINFNI